MSRLTRLTSSCLLALGLVAPALVALDTPARAADTPADVVTVKVGTLIPAYQLSGPAVSGGIAVTDDVLTFGTASITGTATLAGGVTVTAAVRLTGPALTGTIVVSDPAAGVRVQAAGPVGFSRVSDTVVRWSGLASVSRAGRTSLQPATITIDDRVVDAGTHAVNLKHAGQNRRAIVYTPPTRAAKAPVLYHFPGLMEFPYIAEDTGDLIAAAQRYGYVLVIPEHFGPGWQGVLGGLPAPDVDDPGFVRALNTSVLQRFGGDVTRVYATGMSNGGFFTNLLACRLPDVFAAFAPVSGELNDPSTCAPGRAVPIVLFHGDADPIVKYSTVEPALQFWLKNNGCGTVSADVALPDLDPGDGTTVVRRTFPCPATAPVVFYRIIGGGHTWPGGKPYPVPTGKLTKDISANDVIWQFVSRFSL